MLLMVAVRRPFKATEAATPFRRSAAFGTPALRYRCRPSASKMNVVGSDSTDSRLAATTILLTGAASFCGPNG